MNMLKNSAGRPPLAVETASRIENDFADWSDTFLPSNRELCHRYSVSHPIITAAGSILEQKGFLIRRKGRRFALRSAVEESAETSHSISKRRRLYHELLKSIRSGTFRAGHQLPSAKTLCLEHDCSARTLTAAKKDLSAENLIHLHGRRYIVGPRPYPSSLTHTDFRSTIIVIQNRKYGWQAFINPRTEPIARAFSREASLFRVFMESHTVREDIEEDAAIREDLKKVAERIKELGSSYLGALILDSSSQKHIAHLLGVLSVGNAVVVRYGRRNLPFTPRIDRSFYYGEIDEEETCRSCIERLSSLGHITVGFVSQIEEYWEKQRFAALRKAGKQQRIPITVLGLKAAYRRVVQMTPTELKELLEDPEDHRLFRLRKTLKQAMSGSSHSIDNETASTENLSNKIHSFCRARYRDLTASAELLEQLGMTGSRLGTALLNIDFCLPFLLHKELTALIIPNDAKVSHIRRELSGAVVHVPQDLSLISFDNQVSLSGMNTDSVDLGYENLGYLGFHAILGDIPLRRAPGTCRITALPTVAERGSVGSPRKTPGAIL